ncbi:Rap guanine nucleotide exchange factor 4 [Eumeta japonica]|uniref:Rap guanine nucleotide exchange factor 4 n=1 Tax=Eumeta variegata TaxID=151549 RepID=A0A4C1SNW4_EUMVA|nr:Rap guanine nucleotide exchange factor 4 [Eumeta japonica]
MPRGGGRGQKEEDPDKVMKRKFRAKCLFRALGRMVMANAYWLIEDVDEYVGVDDVKRRVEQAVQKKPKVQHLLSIRQITHRGRCLRLQSVWRQPPVRPLVRSVGVLFYRQALLNIRSRSTSGSRPIVWETLLYSNCSDKALLNKPAAERTESEKRYLYKKLGGLKCFKQYPNHVRRKLAGVMYYRYYGPGRVVVRQHQEAHAMYFLVSGELTLSVTERDVILEQDVSREIGIMDAGSVFGDIALLHNMARLKTATTSDHCELLMLLKEDFNNILFTSVQQQWDEVYSAMSFFTYFKDLDAIARREGCIVAKMLSYKTDDTLLGDGCGVPNMVYFMLSGHCQMIESIQVLETRFLSSVSYMLYDHQVSEVRSRHHDIGGDFNEQSLNSKQKVSDLNKQTSNSASSKTTPSGKIERNDSSAVESKASAIKEKKHSILRSSLKVSEHSELAQEGGGVKKVSINVNASESQLILEPFEEDPARGRPSVRLSVTPSFVKEPKPKKT